MSGDEIIERLKKVKELIDEDNLKQAKKIEVDKKYPTLKIVSPYKIINTTNIIVFL